MKIQLSTIYIICFCLICFSCYWDNEEELYANVNSTCDATNVLYSVDIKNIMNTYCVDCHSTATAPTLGSNIILDNHTSILISVQNNSLLGSVKHQNGFSAMPKGGNKLSECEILKIQNWINDGSKNN